MDACAANAVRLSLRWFGGFVVKDPGVRPVERRWRGLGTRDGFEGSGVSVSLGCELDAAVWVDWISDGEDRR
jgi:hypothetical protein